MALCGEFTVEEAMERSERGLQGDDDDNNDDSNANMVHDYRTDDKTAAVMYSRM
jgi:hypothetical protein